MVADRPELGFFDGHTGVSFVTSNHKDVVIGDELWAETQSPFGNRCLHRLGAAPPKKPPPSKKAPLVLGLLCLLGAGGGYAYVRSLTLVDGRVSFQGATTAEGPFALCADGATKRPPFAGVEVATGDGNLKLRFLSESEEVWLSVRGGPTLELTPARCRVFEHRVQALTGHARLACALPELATLKADVRFENCR